MTGRVSSIRSKVREAAISITGYIVLPALLMTTPAAFHSSPAEAGEIDLLIPGVSLRSVSFAGRASVEYLIVSEAYSVYDTSSVRLSVLESEGGKFLLEIFSSPFPEIEEETVTVRLLLMHGISEAGTPEEARGFIEKVFLKEGSGSFAEQTEEEIDGFDLDRLFISDGGSRKERTWGPEEVETPAGSFECIMSEFFRSATDTVKLGGLDAERFEEETSILMVSEKVPFWGVVRSRVEKKSYTRLSGVSKQGRPPSPKVTVTESILVDFSCSGGK